MPAAAVEVEARMRTKGHQKVWPEVHGEIMRGLHREHAQEQSVDGTADQQSSSAIGPASREKKKKKLPTVTSEKRGAIRIRGYAIHTAPTLGRSGNAVP